MRRRPINARAPTRTAPRRPRREPYPATAAQFYHLTLYVAGLGHLSRQAVANLRTVCERHLAGRHALQVVDVYQRPDVAQRDGIVALPALVREKPLPRRVLIGDLSKVADVLLGLGIHGDT